jgi:hypothetical protein
MSIQVQFRRGTATQHLSFTGANGEITVDTTNHTLRIHDGVTVGGFRLAKLSEASSTSGYLEVANAAFLYTTKAYAAANTYVISVYNDLQAQINNRLEVANATILYQTKATERAALANTNLRIALVNTNLTGTNTALRALINDRLQVANAAAIGAGKAPWSALTSTNTALRVLISDRMQVANTKAYLANTNSFIKSQLANTNSYIATKATWTGLTGTNTALRTLISDRLQIANASAKYTTKAYAASNTYLNTNFLNKTMDGGATQTIQSNISFSANVSIQGKLEVTGGITSYYANNVATGDNMIYLNANNIVTNPDLGIAGNYYDGVYHHAGFFRDASDSGTWKVFENYGPEPDADAYIDTSDATFKLAPFAARDIRAQGILAVTANSTLGNTTVGGFLKLGGTDIRTTFAQNTYVKSILANTNAYIASVIVSGGATWSALQSTNTALRLLINDRIQVANVTTLLNNKLSVANSRNYLQVANSKNYLQVANSRNYLQVANSKTYLQVANSKTYLQVANSRNYLQVANSKTYLQVANAVSTYATKSNPTTSGLIQHTGRMTISTNLDVSGNTQIYKLLANGSLGVAGYALKTNGTAVYWDAVGAAGTGTGATWAALTSTNTALRLLISDRLQVANATTQFNTKASWSELTATNTAIRTLVSDRLQVSNATTQFNTKASWTELTSTNTALRTLISDRLQVANATAQFNNKASWTELKATNTALRTLVSDRLQVSNATAQFNTKASWTALTGTNTALRILINDRYQVSNVNTLLAATWAGITGTNTALRTLISDRLQVANATTQFNTKATWVELTATNTAVRTLISDRLQVANATSQFNTKATWTALTGTNTALRVLISDRLQVSNATTQFNAKATWTALTGTNTALRLLISDRLQVSNATTQFNTKASWSELTATNTALRTLISDRMQVANVNANYLSKTLGSTSSQNVQSNVRFGANVAIEGKLSVTGGITSYYANNVATGDNMIYLNANNTVTNPDLGFAGNYNDGTYHHAGFFRDASDAGTFKVFENYGLEPDASPYIDTSHATFKLAPFAARTISVSNNIVVLGNTSIRKLLANGSLGTAGYALKTNGTSVYWDAVGAAGTGGSSNSFSRILVGSNTLISTSTTDQLTILAGSGMIISADPATDTLTFSSTASGGGSLITTTTKALDALKGTDTVITGVSGTLATAYLQVANASAYYATKTSVQGPAFSAYAAATLQTITSGSQQKVLFQTEEFDTNNNFASSRFTPTVAGYYQLNAEVRLDGSSGTGEMMIVIWKNGSEYKRGTNQSGTQIASNFWAMQVSSLVYANGTGDYFEIYVQQGSGADRTITAVNSPNITYFNGAMVRGV